MEVIEAHIDNLDGTDALEEIMSKTPLNMTDIHMARAEMKTSVPDSRQAKASSFAHTCIVTQIYDLVACVRLAYRGTGIRK